MRLAEEASRQDQGPGTTRTTALTLRPTDRGGWIEGVAVRSQSEFLRKGRVARGLMVVVFEVAAEARLATTALEGAGFPQHHHTVFAGDAILREHERIRSRWSFLWQVAGALIGDLEARDRYLAYATANRSALWIRLPDGTQANRVLRILSGFRWLHMWYRGQGAQYDFRISLPVLG
jgi:hypothetical protein